MDRFLIKRRGRRNQGSRDNPPRTYAILDLEKSIVLVEGIKSYQEALAIRHEMKEKLRETQSDYNIEELQKLYKQSHEKRKFDETKAQSFMEDIMTDIIQKLSEQQEPCSEEQLESLQNLGVEPRHYLHLLRCKKCHDIPSIQCDECNAWFCTLHLEQGLFKTLCSDCLASHGEGMDT